MSLIAYIPALHKGYVDFFKKYRGSTLYILSKELIREVPRMDRDIRALEPEEVKDILVVEKYREIIDMVKPNLPLNSKVKIILGVAIRSFSFKSLIKNFTNKNP